MRSLLNSIRALAAGAFAAILPEEDRRRIEGRHQVRAAPWSMALGLAELFAGLGLFLVKGIDRMRGSASGISDELLREAPNSLTSAHIGGGGIVGWLSWLISPLAWLLLGFAVVGGLRIANFVAHREAMAEPAVWLGARVYTRLKEALKRCRDMRLLGPERPDRFFPGSDGQLRILCCRPQPEWIKGAIVQVDGNFFRFMSIGTARETSWFSISYDLSLMPTGEIVRGRLVYRASRRGAIWPGGRDCIGFNPHPPCISDAGTSRKTNPE